MQQGAISFSSFLSSTIVIQIQSLQSVCSELQPALPLNTITGFSENIWGSNINQLILEVQSSFASKMDVAKSHVNALFAKKEPWQIAAISTMSTLLAVWLYQFLAKEESELTAEFFVRFSLNFCSFRLSLPGKENIFQAGASRSKNQKKD